MVGGLKNGQNTCNQKMNHVSIISAEMQYPLFGSNKPKLPNFVSVDACCSCPVVKLMLLVVSCEVVRLHFNGRSGPGVGCNSRKSMAIEKK